MQLELRIALRYLFAPKSHKAVNVISVVSMAGVAVATMAIVVVLSVFNGFNHLALSRLGRLDPDLKVEPASGKVIAAADSLARCLPQEIAGVAHAMPVLRERGLIVSNQNQLPVVLTGIDPAGFDAPGIDSVLIDGIYATDAFVGSDTVAAAQLSVGVALGSELRPVTNSGAAVYVPRRRGRINPANPAAAYRFMPVEVSGVFQVDQPEYDNDLVFLPLERLRSLLEYDNGEASSISVYVNTGYDCAKVKAELETRLGPSFLVLTRTQQQTDTFRMISIEKWVTFLMLMFILLIASFNIVSTLSLLVIEKRQNMGTLRALGASRRMVASVFVYLGWLITAMGGLAGCLAGVALSLIQEHFGLIKLGVDSQALSIESYPVVLDWGDVAVVLVAVLAVGAAISQISRIFTRKIS